MITLPQAFSERIRDQLKEEADLFFSSLETPSPISIRKNPRKKGKEEIGNLPIDLPVPWCENGFYLKERPVFTLDPCFHGGAYYVQEASSLFLDYILRQILPPTPVRVLDLCASPGGKSTLIASRLPEGSLLVSNEVIRSRTATLIDNIIRWGQSEILVTNNDSADFSALRGVFDLLLVDAPCSGEGMFRKDTGSIGEWSSSNLQLCSERQKRILQNAWGALKPGGYLIYSTCTYNPEENEKITEWLCRHFQAESISIPHNFPGIRCADADIAGYRFYPHRVRGEGFYISVLRKNEGEVFSWKTGKKTKKEEIIRLPQEVSRLLEGNFSYTVTQKGNRFSVFPASQSEFIRYLEKYFRVLYAGCEIAEVHNRKLKLLHPLALNCHLNRTQIHTFEAGKETALRFLKKEEISVEAPAGEWILITYNRIALGWGKSLGNRMNNYLPKEWRIRMEIK